MEGGAGGSRDLVDHAANGGGGNEPHRESGATEPCVMVEFDGIDAEGKWRLQQVLELWLEWYHSRASKGSSSRRLHGKMGYIEGGSFDLDEPKNGAVVRLPTDNSKMFNAEYEAVFQDVPRYDRTLDVLPTKERAHDAPPEFHTQARCFNCGSYSHTAKSCHRAPSYSTISENLSKFEPIGSRRGGRGGRGGGRGGWDSSGEAQNTLGRKNLRGNRGMKRFLADGNADDREGERGKRPRDEHRGEENFPRSKPSNGGEPQSTRGAPSHPEKGTLSGISCDTPTGDTNAKIIREVPPELGSNNKPAQPEAKVTPDVTPEEKAMVTMEGGENRSNVTAVLRAEGENDKEGTAPELADEPAGDEDELMYDSDSSDDIIIIRGAQPLAALQTQTQVTSGSDAPKEAADTEQCTKIKEIEKAPVGGTNGGVDRSQPAAVGKSGPSQAAAGANAEKTTPVPQPIIQKSFEPPLIEIVPSAMAGANDGTGDACLRENKKEGTGLAPVGTAAQGRNGKKVDMEEGELDIEEGEIVETSYGPKRVSEPGLFFPVAMPGRNPQDSRKSRRRRGFNGQQFYRSHSHDTSPPNHPPKAQVMTMSSPPALLTSKPLESEIRGGNNPTLEMHASNVSVRPRARQMQMRHAPKLHEGIDGNGAVSGAVRHGTPPPPPLPPQTTMHLPNHMLLGQHGSGANNTNHQNSVQQVHTVHNNISTGNGQAVLFGNTPHNCTPPAPHHLLPPQLAMSGAQQMTQKVVMQSGLVGQQHQPVLARNPQIVVTPPAQHAHQMASSMQPNQHPSMIPGHQFSANYEQVGQQQREHFGQSPVPIGMGPPLGHVAGYQLSNHNQQQRLVARPIPAPQQQYTPQQQVVQLGNSMVVFNTNGQQVVVKPVAR